VLPWQLPANDAADENFRQRMTTMLAGFKKKTGRKSQGKALKAGEKLSRRGSEMRTQ